MVANDNQGWIQSLEMGVHFAEKLKTKKKGHSNNGCPLPNVFTIKYIKILLHSEATLPHVHFDCFIRVTALLEYLDFVSPGSATGEVQRSDGIPCLFDDNANIWKIMRDSIIMDSFVCHPNVR